MIPRDWRGVFAAIRSGNWASAAGRHRGRFRTSLLTPVAKAELYTAKGSPTVDLARRSRRCSPKRPTCRRPSSSPRMAMTRGATDRAADRAERGRLAWLGSAPRPLPRPAGRRASRPPTSCAPRSIRWSRPTTRPTPSCCSCRRAPYAVLRGPGRGRAARRLGLLSSLGRDADARRVADTWPRRRDRRLGGAGGLDLRPRVVAAQRLRMPPRAPSAKSPSRARERELGAGGYYWAARAEQACRRPRSVAPLLQAPRPARRKASTACSRARRSAWTSACRPTPHRGIGRDRERCPTSAARRSWSAIGERRLAEEMLRHQAQIGSPCRSSWR